jgi:histidyl-tRNA synthetase
MEDSMIDTPPGQRSKGMRDLLPDEMERVRAVESAFAQACRAWGYREIRTPVLEPMHLFTSAGTLSPQTLDRVYSFLDWDGWSGERVVLRPDSTIPAARLYAEQLDGGRIAKLFYRQNVFRFTDDDSPREEWQCGVELIGETGQQGDVELILLALDALKPLRLPAATVRISHAGVVRGVLSATGMVADEQSAAYDRLLDGDVGVIADIESRLPQLNAALRLLFEVEGAGSAYLANLRSPLLGALPSLASAIEELEFAVGTLEACGVTPVVQAALARSFEYYSGVVTRFECDGRRVANGGRYDELIRLIGGRAVPASGFALYVSPLVELMAEEPAADATPGILVLPGANDPGNVAAAFEAAARLREAGYCAEISEGPQSRASATLVCGAGAYEVRRGAEPKRYSTLDAAIDALGSPR